ncbi:MAG: threonine--tRNA ligase [Eubacteriales bacterium]|nr:threonine--tRNA ligase [Eubacteriales bacterium]
MEKEKEEQLHMYRHSMAHILAKALTQLWPDVKLTIGPAIDNGFYYDIDMEHAITPDDFKSISDKMDAIIKNNEDFVRHEVTKQQALEMFKNNPYKTELIEEMPEDEIITVYNTGDDFVDLCRGPHVENTKYLRGFAYKIAKVNGAYWRGNEKNKMLQRVYVYGFLNKEDLKQYVAMMEEAAQRDHRKLGKDLGIFMFSDLVGKGLPMWLPNGFIVRRALSDYIIDKELALGYKHVMTPSLATVDLYKTSGHWDHYHEDMFPSMKREDEEYVLRPMNCPHHMMIFKSFMHSYKDLPLRMAEIANDFRFEGGGSLCGIERARAFTQNDSHIFCRPDQIASEVENVIKLILDVYKDFGFEKYSFRLSLRDENNAEKYFGNDDLWEKSESALRNILKDNGADFYEAKGEAAFYGPKIDVQVRSALGHDVTLSTIQLDYQLPEKFELEYVDENNQKVRPVVIHRAILGSLDRFVAFLLEETKGVLPVWLCPVQVKVLNIADSHLEYANKVKDVLLNNGVRVELDSRNEKIGKKIREAQLEKVPYMLIIGDKEVEEGKVSVRHRKEGDKGAIRLDDFVELIKAEIKSKSIN